MKCLKLKITVADDSRGFCFSTMEAAVNNRITGYIKRTAVDQFVAEIQGEEEDLNRFLQKVNTRIKWTKITNILVTDGVMGDYSSFEIKQNNGFAYHPDASPRLTFKTLHIWLSRKLQPRKN